MVAITLAERCTSRCKVVACKEGRFIRQQTAGVKRATDAAKLVKTKGTVQKTQIGQTGVEQSIQVVSVAAAVNTQLADARTLDP